MAYPGETTTAILPITGSLSLSTIGTLSGVIISPPGFSPDIAPYRLSNFRGQDFDIPTGSNPIKFSNLRGAINYKRNYTLYIGGNSILVTGSQDVGSLYYRGNGGIHGAPYGAKSLSNISNLLDIKIKGSSTNSADTFALTTGTINASWAGDIDHDVTLWMQINNDTVHVYSKQISSTTIEVSRDIPLTDFITQLTSNLGVAIAPEVVTTLAGEQVLNPFTPVTSIFSGIINIAAFTVNTNNLLTRLKAVLNNLSANTSYEVSLSKTTASKLTFKASTYVKVFAPLCYPVGTASHHVSKNGWATASVAISLYQYPISPGSVIKFYIGPGPGTPASGSLWGLNTGGMMLTLDVVNTPRITYT